MQLFQGQAHTAVRVKREPGLLEEVPTTSEPEPTSQLPTLPSLEPTLPSLKEEPQHESESPPTKRQTSAMSDLLGDIFIIDPIEAPVTLQCEEEVKLYRKEACIGPDCNPLDWWRCNQAKYPSLAQLARCYLAVPGTSVPSERVFSTAGDVVTAQRATLNAESVDRLIFIKKNAKLV